MSKASEAARDTYFKALAVMDPVRLRFWDSRGVTVTQLRVMHLIRLMRNASTGELADRMRIRPATLTGLGDRLDQKGFIERWSDNTDRRVVRISLTNEGSALLDEAFAAGSAFTEAIFELMGPEATADFNRAVDAFVGAAARVQAETEATTVRK